MDEWKQRRFTPQKRRMTRRKRNIFPSYYFRIEAQFTCEKKMELKRNKMSYLVFCKKNLVHHGFLAARCLEVTHQFKLFLIIWAFEGEFLILRELEKEILLEISK